MMSDPLRRWSLAGGLVVALVGAAACGGDDDGGSTSEPDPTREAEPVPEVTAPATAGAVCDLVAAAELAPAFGVAAVATGRPEDAFDIPTCTVDVPLAERTMAVAVAVSSEAGECGAGSGAFACEVDRATEVLGAAAEPVEELGDVAAWVQPADTPLTSATLVVREDLVVLQLSASGLERDPAIAAAHALVAALG